RRPFAVLLLALLPELVRLPGLRRVVRSLPSTVLDSGLWLAALSGFAAALAGWLLSHEGGYDAGLLDQHLWSGVATGIGAFACVLVRSFAKMRPDQAVLHRLGPALVVGACGTMLVAPHFGGSLTHGEGLPTAY